VCVDNTPTRVPTDTATADVAIVHATEDIVADMNRIKSNQNQNQSKLNSKETTDSTD
jgi:hypothetical protein